MRFEFIKYNFFLPNTLPLMLEEFDIISSANIDPKERRLYKMGKMITRKCRLPVHMHPYQITAIHDAKTPRLSSALQVYFLKQCKSQIAASLPQVQFLQDESIDLKEIESLEQFSQNFILKNRKNDHIQCSQTYDRDHVFLIANLKDVYVEELSSSICALANLQAGGVLFIAQQHSDLIIKSGIKYFTSKDFKKFRENLQSSLKRIVFAKNIQIKVEAVPIYESLIEALSEKNSQQFIIKITVFPKPGSKNLFFIQQKIPKPTHIFYSIQKIKQPLTQKYKVQKVEEDNIYIFMQNVANIRMKPYPKISRNKKLSSNIIFELEKFIAKQIDEKTKYQYNFSAQTNQLLPSILNALASLGRKQIGRQFYKIQKNQSIVQFQISESSDDTVRKIEAFLNGSKTKYKFIFPLPQFQREYFEFKKVEASKAILWSVCYLIFQGKFTQLSSGIQKLFFDTNQNVIMNEVTQKVTTSASMWLHELQALQNFLWQFFDSIPKIKKIPSGQSNSSDPIFKSVEFSFPRIDLNIAAFTFFILTLAKKRPH